MFMMRLFAPLILILMTGLPWPAFSATDKPNILLIMSDDVGITNISAYGEGLVGYKTPNIDRIANEGTRFTDYYAEQSCTAGRSAFVTGQLPVRTGLTKVGLPGAELGLRKEDPTLAGLLKNHGYMTGQFGKNHLGDRNEFLPTVHGFDEFFGNLYHLNAEEEPEHPDYPKDPEFREKFGPRGVLKCRATDEESDIDDPRFGAMGKQQCEDTGPLTRKRMQTADDEFTAAAIDFIERAHQADKPFMLWFDPSRMHLWTHLKPESQANLEKYGLYGAGMLEHDTHIGILLDELGIAENTIVVYTSDNGLHYNGWPDGGISPFRGEKNTNWEGGFRVPGMVRWPGKIKAGYVSNAIMSHLDWVPTLMAASGDNDIKEKLLEGHEAAGSNYKVHLDGENFLPYLSGAEKEGPRKDIFYFDDGGQLIGLRFNKWKVVFAEQRAKSWDVWSEPFVQLRLPKIFDLRADPFERADTDANGYNNWWIDHLFLLVPAQTHVAEQLQTFAEYPPRQKPAIFNVQEVLEGLRSAKATN
jgi:arylsulfatase